MAAFRILSLDGGGAWALIQVKTLINLFSAKGDGTDIRGHDVLKKFDLAIANSGGSITLGGLVKNLLLSEILGLFADEASRKKIFVKASFLQDPFSHLTQLAGVGPKYDTKAKLLGLKSLLGPDGEQFVTALPGAVGNNYAGKNVQFVICGFDYDRNRETFFRSNAKSLAGGTGPHADITLAQAIHASTNAPVNYFDAPAAGPNATRYWDGAIGGFNNPVLAGVIESIANSVAYGTDRGSILALSLGTGNIALPLSSAVPHEDPDVVVHRETSTIPNDIKKLATAILDDPPDAASFHAYMMLNCPLPPAQPVGKTCRLVRMNPLLQPRRDAATNAWILPAAIAREDFVALRDLDMDAVEPAQTTLIAKFCDLWLADKLPNQPIRANGQTLAADIGHGLFSQAKKAWQDLTAPPAAKPAPPVA